MPACNGLTEMSSYKVCLTHNISNLSTERILTAIRALTDPNRRDLDDIVISLAYRAEVMASVISDLRGGPTSVDSAIKEQNIATYDAAVAELEALSDDEDVDGVNQIQINILKDFKQIQNRLVIVIGGDSTTKTSTLAMQCCILMAIGHRIMICSEDSKAANEFIRTFHYS